VELKEKINEKTRDIPVLLLSVSGEANKSEGLRLGAVDFFKKPIDFNRLNMRIKSLTSRKKVMIIENEIEILRLMELKLGSLGYEVIKIENGINAVAIIKEQKPDLIMVDYLLPKKDGFEIIEDLKNSEHTAHIPIIVFSGYINEDFGKMEIIGADKFSGGQFSLNELTREINIVLENRNNKKRG